MSTRDRSATILLHLPHHPNQLVLVVNDRNGMLEGWYETGNEEEMWDFIVKAEELGLAEVKEIAIPQGIYNMPQRSDGRGTQLHSSTCYSAGKKTQHNKKGRNEG
jgi:hypothetical protein